MSFAVIWLQHGKENGDIIQFHLSPVGGGFLYCSMSDWIFSHTTFGSSTLGICIRKQAEKKRKFDDHSGFKPMAPNRPLRDCPFGRHWATIQTSAVEII